MHTYATLCAGHACSSASKQQISTEKSRCPRAQPYSVCTLDMVLVKSSHHSSQLAPRKLAAESNPKPSDTLSPYVVCHSRSNATTTLNPEPRKWASIANPKHNKFPYSHGPRACFGRKMGTTLLQRHHASVGHTRVSVLRHRRTTSK